MYDTEMYWCHQMLFPDWKADVPHSGKFLEFTEKDFLVTLPTALVGLGLWCRLLLWDSILYMMNL
jgi:hypothetical protein